MSRLALLKRRQRNKRWHANISPAQQTRTHHSLQLASITALHFALCFPLRSRGGGAHCKQAILLLGRAWGAKMSRQDASHIKQQLFTPNSCASKFIFRDASANAYIPKHAVKNHKIRPLGIEFFCCS